jgi:protein SCO1/2
MRKAFQLGIIATLLLTATPSFAQMAPEDTGTPANGMPAILRGVTFRPELNAQLPLNLDFKDETGSSVKIGDYFGKQKPVVLAFVYYGCPMLCTQLEQGLVGSLRMLSFNPGRDYDVVFISFDDRDTPHMAAQKKVFAMDHFHRKETAAGWHFLCGSRESIAAVTNAANFHFNFDAKNNVFAHASGVMLLTPEGRISRYFYGVEFPGRDLRLGLVDASQGKIGTPMDKMLLFCFQYDPSAARYSATILGVMRLVAVATVAGLVGLIVFYRRRDLRAQQPNLHRQGAH